MGGTGGSGDDSEGLRVAAKSVDSEHIGPFQPEKHGKPDRVKVLESPDWESDLIFKGVRSGAKGLLDMFCDTLYGNLGNAYGVPTPVQAPVYLDVDDLGFGVVSQRVDGKQGIHATLDEMDNAEKMPILVTFEEWVLNSDDKEPHFWTLQGGPTEVWIVDHGHTVPRNPHLKGLDAVQDYEGLYEPASSNNHFFESIEAVADGIAVIQSVADGEISDTLDLVSDQFRSLEGNGRLTEFMDSIEDYIQAAEYALQERRDHIESIMHKKYGS